MNRPRLNMGTPENRGALEQPPSMPEAPPIEVPPPPDVPKGDKTSEELIPRTTEKPREDVSVSQETLPEQNPAHVPEHIREQDITEGPMLDITDANRLAEMVNQNSK